VSVTERAAPRPTTSRVLTPWSRQAVPKPPVMVRGERSYLYDDAGKRYLDLSAGLVAVNLGHGHPKVVAAIQEQVARLCYVSPAMGNDVRDAFAEELSALAPWREGARTFFTTGGGEANEDAVKMARMITGRHKVVTAYRSYHGSAPGAGTMTGEDRRWANEPGIPGVVRMFAPYPFRTPFPGAADEVAAALEHLELVLTYENPASIAALVIEPVVGSNGVVVYPEGYLAGVRRICDAHGILLVFDEVMTGFGRLGERFGAIRFGVQPDMITFAKGVTSAYVPLGGVLVREGLAAHFDERPLMCGHTYSGHPVAMAAGLATIRTMRDEGLFVRAREIEPWLRSGLEGLKERHAVVGDVRGIGAFFAIEFVADRATKRPLVPWYGGDLAPMGRFLGALRAQGVYAFGRYNVVLISPPLTVTRDEVEEGIAAIDRVLASGIPA
jgi:taurine---2-oxoglutarate transaminase